MKLSYRPILIKTFELVLLVLSFLIIFGPMISLFLWSVAQKWYWPNPLHHEIIYA